MNLASIKLTVTGAQAWATVTGPLTSGMVGLPVTIEYDETWDGLTKNLVCRCSPWGSNDGEVRTILNVGKTVALCLSAEGALSLWLDGEYVSSAPGITTANSILVGNNANGFRDMTVSAARIYEGIL